MVGTTYRLQARLHQSSTKAPVPTHTTIQRYLMDATITPFSTSQTEPHTHPNPLPPYGYLMDTTITPFFTFETDPHTHQNSLPPSGYPMDTTTSL